MSFVSILAEKIPHLNLLLLIALLIHILAGIARQNWNSDFAEDTRKILCVGLGLFSGALAVIFLFRLVGCAGKGI